VSKKFTFSDREAELLQIVLSRAAADTSAITAVTPAGYLAREVAGKTIQALLTKIEEERQ
jgi:hypothetical protein